MKKTPNDNDMVAPAVIGLDGAAREQIAQAVLEHLAYPLLVVSHDGAVVHGNASGHQFVAGRNGLQVKDGRLTATRASEATTLRKLLTSMMSPDTRDGRPGVLTFASRQGRIPKAMLLIPMMATSIPSAGLVRLPDGLLLAAIIDTPHKLVPDDQLVRSVYGLSAAEARIALKIAAGQSLSQIALDGSTSLHTVRTQLKAIFIKTGTSRQAQLALNLASLAPAVIMAPG